MKSSKIAYIFFDRLGAFTLRPFKPTEDYDPQRDISINALVFHRGEWERGKWK